MTRKEKSRILEALVARLSSADYFYVVNAEGLNAEEVDDFRRRCFQAGVVYQVVKNTLISKALEKLGSEVDYSAFGNAILKGFSGILFAKDSGSIPAKIIKDFRSRRKLAIPTLKGASIDKALFIGEKYLDDLSQLKSRTELLGELIGLLKSPVTRVVASIQSSTNRLASLVQALAESKA